jgi:hypothetical protein
MGKVWVTLMSTGRLITECSNVSVERLKRNDKWNSAAARHRTKYLSRLYERSCLLLLSQLEKASRVLFLWKTEVEEQRERASDMRRRNEALVYNILPPHVATHFLGSRKRQHDELYSQSYSEVGVLFASMPNFSGKHLLFLVIICLLVSSPAMATSTTSSNVHEICILPHPTFVCFLQPLQEIQIFFSAQW